MFDDWKYWKAQLYQESRFKVDAISPVGASGLAQFMPRTWRAVAKRLNYEKYSPKIPKYAIYAGAFYMRQQWNMWSSPRPQLDRLFLAQASYNAGAGNIIKAQKECNMASTYEGIIECLPKVTGHHSKETITYTKRIKRWRLLLD
ncbi:MAG: transglycosylase SLT domain-containing protein [Helicobacteraceae bacterium]|nr:transglycosylase SLT domain-containing protein [Helicobacteraceae bacterium]